MRVILCEDYKELSKKAAELFAAQLTLKPNSVIGFSTGESPVGMYKTLVKMNKSGKIDFSNVTTFNLDEYYPIERSNKHSYFSYMKENLFAHININMDRTYIPDGEVDDPTEECDNYERKIQMAGGIDLQVLGFGQSGQVGFNEPDASLNSRTHLAELTHAKIKTKSKLFGSEDVVPKKAITMGMGTIMGAKKIILLASGASKSRVVAELLNDGINTSFPVTLLKTHPDVVLICDKDAYLGAKLGVDIGGTNIKFAVIEGGNVKYQNCIDTEKTADAIVKSIKKEADALKKEYKIKAIGMGTPGIIKDGLVSATNLPFKEFALDTEVAECTGLPVAMDNDANCAALGEVFFGSTADCDNIVLVTLGTGIGGGIIINRQIMSSNNGGGEIGHMIIDSKDGRPCGCGQAGCWEQYASITALIRDAVTAAKANPDSLLNDIYTREGKLNGRLIFKALDEKCPVAEAVFDTYLDYLAVGIKSINMVIGPDAVVLAGGITKEGDKLLTPLKKKLPEGIRVEVSTLQNDAGSLGAAML